MGDLGHPLHSLNCRKRKLKSDSEEERQGSLVPRDTSTPTNDDILVDPPSPPHHLSNAPRQPPSSPWISTDTARAVWPSEHSPTDSLPVSPLTPTDPESPQRLHKRPRVDTDNLPSFKSQRRQNSSVKTPSSPRSPWRSFRKTDHRDLPSPSHRPPQFSSPRIDPQSSSLDSPNSLPHIPQSRVDLTSPHIPSMHPLINRQTLKELDLNSILRNPQLRHDLLFDAGLQFRPTSGRRKRDLSEKYWRAVAQELQTGCTCISFDCQWKPHDLICVCHRVPIPQTASPTFCPSRRAVTLRMPSRIRPLLTEFLEVLLFVIQPLTSISGTYANPSTLQTQIEQHAAQAAHLRSLFDPELIQQELHHELFDPSGLFTVIGQTLKSHCAPMRDRAVDAMVEAAKACAPGRGGSKADAVKAVRMCLDILELMKLDIANHQLQTLRPFLIETAGQYELKAFKGRKGAGSSLDVTRKWMQTAYQHLMSSHTIPHPSSPSSFINYRLLPQTQQIYLSVLKGLTDLVFDPPCGPSHSSSVTPRVPKSTIPHLPLYPETTYLDGARLVVLSGEAADATAMYMFLLLFRQLVFSDPSDPTLKVSDAQLASLKKEIRDISSSHLSHCFNQGSSSDPDNEKWAKVRQDIVLQIAMRAKEAQTSRPGPSSCSQSGVSPPPLASAPDERMLKLAERWSDSNMRPDSSLSKMLRNRIRDVVFNQVVALTFPSRDSAMCLGKPLDCSAFASTTPPSALASGLEPLADEIRLLSERLSRLAYIHLGVYLPLYEEEGFASSVLCN